MEFLYGFNENINVAETLLTLPIQPTCFHIGQGEPELQEVNCILADGGDRFGVSTVHFDPIEELIWMGNQGGHVTSYYGAALQKYTSFQVHANEPVHQIEFTDTGILCLTNTTLRYQIRRGIPKKTYRSKFMVNTHCMLRTSPETLVIGGQQDTLIELDLTKFTEKTTIPLDDDGCAVIRSHHKYLCCGNTSGKISLRDPSTFKEEHCIKTHSGSLSDFDVQGNYLISCGYSGGRHGKLIADRFLLVYDLRMHRLISPIHTVIDPLLMHFLPLHCSRLALLSPMGELQLVDTVELSKPRVCMYQINTAGAQALTFAISSTTQAFAFGDQAGKINLVGSVDVPQPHFNAYSRPTEFADVTPPLPMVPITDRSFPMSSIPLPRLPDSHSRYSSDMLPDWFMKYQYLQPKPISPSVLENLRMNGPIGYALNTQKIPRNLVPYDLNAAGCSSDLTMTPINKVKMNHETGLKMIPRRYRKVEIKFSKVGTQEIDYDQYNKTDFSGLEAILPNAYCNPMLQLLYFIGPLRKMLLQHNCLREHCLSCELGFLFHMLDISSPPQPPCQASNFLRVFRTVPEAAALGLILSDRNGSEHTTNLISLIQNWNRFILHQMHSETMEHKRKHTNSETLSTGSDHTTDVSENSQTEVNGSDTSSKVNGVQKRLNVSSGSESKSTNCNIENSKETKDKDNGSKDIETERTESSNTSSNEIDESEISQLFGTKQECIYRCIKCNEERQKSTIQMVCNLIYPTTHNNTEHVNGKTVTFKQVLETSLCFDKTTPAWCDNCKKFTPTNQRCKVKDLPNILSINTGLDNERDLEYLKFITGNGGPPAPAGASGIDGISENVSPVNFRGPGINGYVRQCRYGSKCTRVDCHFGHPDGKSASTSTNSFTNNPSLSSGHNSSSSVTNSSKKPSSWFPLSFTMGVQQSGGVVITNEKIPDQSDSTVATASASSSTSNSVAMKLEYTKIEETVTVTETTLDAEVKSVSMRLEYTNIEETVDQKELDVSKDVELSKDVEVSKDAKYSNGDKALNDDQDSKDAQASYEDESKETPVQINGDEPNPELSPEPKSEDVKLNGETPGTPVSINEKNYTLTAVVCQINEGNQRNLIALVNVEKAYHELKHENTTTKALPPEHRWYLFNDFTVAPVSVSETVWFTFDWKVPTVLYYTAVDTVGSQTVESMKNYKSPITFDLLREPELVHKNGKLNGIKYQPFTPFNMPRKGYLVAMDAEFVTLNQEENEIRADGKMSTIKPKLQNAARITCIHGQGPFEGIPFMDDYISTHEQVVDYLTKFSGIKPGDLDAHFSKKRLTTLKKSYQKLRYLIDTGIVFVGHGLRNDFRVINMIVPPEQIIDTVYLFHIPHHRMISLRFLAWHFLGIKIQSETHDSIEDARTALHLYKHYLHLKSRNALTVAISNLYDVGTQLMWKVPEN